MNRTSRTKLDRLKISICCRRSNKLTLPYRDRIVVISVSNSVGSHMRLFASLFVLTLSIALLPSIFKRGNTVIDIMTDKPTLHYFDIRGLGGYLSF